MARRVRGRTSVFGQAGRWRKHGLTLCCSPPIVAIHRLNRSRMRGRVPAPALLLAASGLKMRRQGTRRSSPPRARIRLPPPPCRDSPHGSAPYAPACLRTGSPTDADAWDIDENQLATRRARHPLRTGSSPVQLATWFRSMSLGLDTDFPRAGTAGRMNTSASIRPGPLIDGDGGGGSCARREQGAARRRGCPRLRPALPAGRRKGCPPGRAPECAGLRELPV